MAAMPQRHAGGAEEILGWCHGDGESSIASGSADAWWDGPTPTTDRFPPAEALPVASHAMSSVHPSVASCAAGCLLLLLLLILLLPLLLMLLLPASLLLLLAPALSLPRSNKRMSLWSMMAPCGSQVSLSRP